MAERMIRAQAVEFLADKPMRLKSGLVTPVYVDNRKLAFYPEAWSDVVETMASRVEEFHLEFDVVAGVETAGSMHAAALAYRLLRPCVMVRQKAKTYGNRSRLEGGLVKGLRVLLLEDHISTGISCLDAIRALRDEGAEVTQVMSVTNFAIPETVRLLSDIGVRTYDVISFDKVVSKAVEMGVLQDAEHAKVVQWLKTPWTWAALNGLVAETVEN
ncbi:MAG: orotate phosphoribosyltransferase [Duodenibacillus sp.]|nr:orotate phosphoribosyltransferase [Duodenibacillus sp.]